MSLDSSMSNADTHQNTPPVFTLADAAILTEHMPALTFEPQTDCLWAKNATAQQYLNYYQINFAATDPTLRHGFGRINIELDITRVATSTHFAIATHYWLPPAPRGTLVILHGYYDHIGVFDHAIAFGLARNLAVLTFDLPGHGLSSGDRAAIDSFDQYADVLQHILSLASTRLPAPFYALGQSTGGAILLNHLWRYPTFFQKTALCAPLVLPQGWGLGRYLYLILHRWVKDLPRKPSHNSHDEHFIRFIDEQDCLQPKRLSVRWVGAMKAWHRQFLQFSPSNTRLLLVQGTADSTVTWRYNIRVIQRKLPYARCVFIPDAGHQLVNELPHYRAKVFMEIGHHFFDD